MTIGGRKTILRNCTKLRGMSGQLARQIRWDNCGLKSQLEEGSPMGLVDIILREYHIINCMNLCVCVCVWSVAQSFLTLCEPTRLFCPWNSPGKNTGVGCHALLQGIFLIQGSNPDLLHLLHWQVKSLHEIV